MIKFALYFRGSCSRQYRGHDYTFSIQRICDRRSSIKDNRWIKSDVAKEDYKWFHTPDTPDRVRPKCYIGSKWGEGIKPIREEWPSKIFYTESSINPSSCIPILKIKLLKNPHEYKGDEFEGLNKFCSCRKECQTKEEQKENDESETSTMEIETKFAIIILSVAGGIVFFIILALALKYLKKRRKFRGP